MAEAGSKTDAWMPLWVGAYLADTMHLTTLQHGAYLLLLMAYWRERAPLRDDDDGLRSITKTERAEWKKLRPVLVKFFVVEAGGWRHKRVELELASAEARQKAAQAKAEAAAKARWGKHPKEVPKQAPGVGPGNAWGNAPSMPQALPEDMHDECPTPSPTPCIPTPSQKIETSVSVGHTLFSESFKAEISKRPELDALRVWEGFCEHYPQPKRTLAKWRQWVQNERIPLTKKAGEGSDGAGPDPLQDPNSRASIERLGELAGLGRWDGLKESFVAYKARVLARPGAAG